MGLNGVNIYEELRYLQHAIANQPNLKLVIVGADFFSFNSHLANPPVFSESRLEKQHITLQDAVKFGFSIDALSASVETVTASNKTPNQKSSDYLGFSPYSDVNKAENEWRFKVGINDYFQNHDNYDLSNQYLDDFKKIVDLCQQNNIKLKIFISPSHATQWEAIRATGHWQTFEEWKRQLVKIAPVWDFSGYNSVTTEPIGYDIENYTDNSHYTSKVGTWVLNRLLSYQTEQVPKDFGVLITPNNIEAHLAKIRVNRDLWARKYPDEVQLVQDIKQEYDANPLSGLNKQ
ncbi:hypothetical protein IQ257_10980 [Coleofasciculus sp. LEGE 07092]|nr:hypothetical protein [Coleofasciculus sp. LEGE 07081]MBE9149008.1 hypothetical protein [Coleofasciculus sp. LEGE 07092]